MLLTERIAIFIDRKSFTKMFEKNKIPIDGSYIPIEVWKQLNNDLLNAYRKKCKTQDKKIHDSDEHHIHHLGTWLFVAERSDLLSKEATASEVKREWEFKKHMEKVDSLYGYVVKYGIKSYSQKRKRFDIKKVDTNIICHMMHGAFQNHFDIALLISDNEEFVPVIEMVQDHFGKQVYHTGFKKDRLRATCFGNIPLEESTYNSWMHKNPKKI